jgi:2-methylcitrate dehydratase PrpD
MLKSNVDPSNSGATRELASRILSIGYSDLDAAAIAHAKVLFLDHLGCVLIGSTLPWSKKIYRTIVKFGGSPQARVANYGTRLAVPDAAFMNAVFSQGCEWDDYSLRSMGAGHPGAGTWPTALSMGEYLHASGRDLLVAGAAGYECMTRLGKAVRPFRDPSHPVNGILSPLGAAAVAGSLMQISPHQMTMALSIAASHSGGLNEYSKTGGEVKRLYAGNGARSGIHSVFLSLEGLTGPVTGLEGEAGLVRSFGKKPKVEELTKPSTELAIMEAGIRLYPTVGLTNSSIEAMMTLIKQHGFSREQVDKIVIAVAPWAQEHSGFTEVTDVTSAQYSIPYSTALQVVLGSQDLAHYMDERLWKDERILDIMRKVKFEDLPNSDGDARHSCRMTVTLKGGAKHEAFISHPKGSFLNPITPAEAKDKFGALAERVVGARAVERLTQAVDELENLSDVTELLDLLCKS